MLQKIFTVLFFLKLREYHLKELSKVRNNWVVAPIEGRIVGGDSANLTEYPSNVQFFNFGGMCSGNILTSNMVLTAAHCFDFNKKLEEMSIFSNCRYVFDRNGIRHEVLNYLIHENYNKPVIFSNDIALIMIKNKFTFGPSVKKALLINNADWMSESEHSFIATGWGLTEENGKTSSNGLQKTSLRFVSRKHCEKMNHAVVSPDMFCLFGDGQRDTCKGDSGGGVLFHEYTVGIVSHGEGCARAPSMYVNIYLFRNWIEGSIHVLHRQYCQQNSSSTRIL